MPSAPSPSAMPPRRSRSWSKASTFPLRQRELRLVSRQLPSDAQRACHGAPGYAAAIALTAERSASFGLERTTGTSTGDQQNSLSLFANLPAGHTATFKAIGNRLSGHGNPGSGVGIFLGMIGAGTVRSDIYNNVVWDVGRSHAGAASGIAILPGGTTQADVNIVGNTVERSDTDGLQQRNMLTAGGRMRLDLFNNVFSHAKGRGIGLSSGVGSSFAFRAGYNDLYANGSNDFDGQSKGPGNMALPPGFVDRAQGLLNLTGDSRLIDRGQVCSPGRDRDARCSGSTRLEGGGVDVGAYERGNRPVTGVVRLGNGGPNLLLGHEPATTSCAAMGATTSSWVWLVWITSAAPMGPTRWWRAGQRPVGRRQRSRPPCRRSRRRCPLRQRRHDRQRSCGRRGRIRSGQDRHRRHQEVHRGPCDLLGGQPPAAGLEARQASIHP